MLKINSRQEILNLGTVLYDAPNTIRIIQYGVFNLKDNNYPKYFKYFEPYDAHFCGDYCETTKEEYKNYLTNKIKKLKKQIKELQRKLNEEEVPVEDWEKHSGFSYPQ